MKVKKGGEACISTRKRLSPIDRRLQELQDEVGKPRSRKWLACQIGVSYNRICRWCNGKLPDSLKNVYVLRVMQILDIDENYLLGLPQTGRL